MGAPIQQSFKPSGQPAHGAENRQDPSPASNGGHPRSEQDEGESMVAEDGSNNGDGDPVDRRARDTSLPRDPPPSTDQSENLLGVGDWTDKNQSPPASDYLDLA